MKVTELPPALRLLWIASRIDIPMLATGGIAAVAGERWGAYVLIAYLFLKLGSHLAVGIFAYSDAILDRGQMFQL